MIGLDGCCRVAAMGESRCRAGELSESCVSGRASWGDGELAERARRVAAGVSAPAVSASDACGEGGARRPSTAAAAGDSIAAGIPTDIKVGPAAGINMLGSMLRSAHAFSKPQRMRGSVDAKNARCNRSLCLGKAEALEDTA